jgi:hypothetical protein
MVIKENHEQPEKQRFPIEVTLFEIVIKDKNRRPEN